MSYEARLALAKEAWTWFSNKGCVFVRVMDWNFAPPGSDDEFVEYSLGCDWRPAGACRSSDEILTFDEAIECDDGAAWLAESYGIMLKEKAST